MCRKLGGVIFGLTVLCLAQTAGAQQVAVQQPVMSNFSVGTSVSVPDRGRVVLGGVSRAGNSRSTYGPLRSGTNTGVFAQGSSATAHVVIHDFAEMDRLALSAAPSNSRDDHVPLNGNAEHAYRVLRERSAASPAASTMVRRR